MNSAELQFWGSVEAMKEYLSWVRPPNEEMGRYDDRHDFEFSVIFAEELGEAGETLLAELMKMKEASEVAEPTLEVTTQESVAV
jgi:hypothetical protein